MVIGSDGSIELDACNGHWWTQMKGLGSSSFEPVLEVGGGAHPKVLDAGGSGLPCK